MTWERVALRDLGDWFGGGTPFKGNPDFWAGGDIPWLSPKDMGPSVLAGTQDRITEAAVAQSSVRKVPRHSVAVVVRSGILERTLPIALVPFETTLNQDMKAVVARPGIDPSWVAWGLRAFEHTLLRDTRKAGTTVASIEMPRFMNATLPVPELAEQRRVVEILEDHLSRLDAADQYLVDSLRRQGAWSSASLQQLVWGRPFELATVAEVLREPMRNGRSDRASTDPHAVRTLTLTAVTRRDFSNANTKLTSTSREVAKGLWLRRGDVLVQRSNTPELVGTSALYNGPDDWAIFPDLLIRLRPDEARMSSRFLAAALRSERAHRSLRAKAKGLAGSMPKIDQGALGATLIPLPPRAVQEAIADGFDEVARTAARLGDAMVAAQRRSQGLRRAVLAAAFEGKLTGRHADMEVIEELADVQR